MILETSKCAYITERRTCPAKQGMLSTLVVFGHAARSRLAQKLLSGVVSIRWNEAVKTAIYV